MKAIVLHAHGGPDQLRLEDGPDLSPGRGEVVVKVDAAGVNFMDVGFRRGLARLPLELPVVLGVEGAGVVQAVGEKVERLRVGDRVAWFMVWGSYAETVKAPEHLFVPVPDAITSETAAAIMMQGLTASHFVTDTYAVQPGDTALIHAAAGGVGQILTQMVKRRGGKVIAVVSRAEKREAARAAGADAVIVAENGLFADAVLDLTDGRGVNVVYDGNGGETFAQSLETLDFHGTLAVYGPMHQPIPPLDIFALQKSQRITYPIVGHHVRTPEALRQRASELFSALADGALSVAIGGRYGLGDAAKAHAALESRTTTGKLLLIP